MLFKKKPGYLDKKGALARAIISFFLLSVVNELGAQSIIIGGEADTRLRAAQLQGLLPSDWSLSIRPSAESRFLLTESDSLLAKWVGIRKTPRNNVWAEWTPLVAFTSHNTRHPWGWNDRGLWQQHGRNNAYRFGVRGGAGVLEIQLQPELIWHENAKFDTTRGILYISSYWRRRSERIDLPVRNAQFAYFNRLPGQSYVRINAGPIQAGVSTENLWFGPGMEFDLLMTNNAPGFLNAYVATRHPIRTRIGSFEGRILAGRLENSDQYKFRRKDQFRLVHAAAFTFQPAITPGLSIGLIQTYQTDQDDLHKGWRPYLPMPWLFNSNGKPASANPVNDLVSDEQIAFFMRWVWPESQAEFYGEIASTQDSLKKAEMFLNPEVATAFLFGFRKDLLPSKNRSLFAGLEVLKMEKAINQTSASNAEWYYHYSVRDGWTHDGQLLGAGIAPNSNARIVRFEYFDARNRATLRLMHMVYNNVMYYDLYKNDRWRHWVDMNIGFSFSHRFKTIIAGAEVVRIQTYNRHFIRDNDHMNIYSSFFLQFGL